MNFKERKSNNRFDVLKRNTEEISFRSTGKKRQNAKQKKKQDDNEYYIPEEFLNKEQPNTFQPLNHPKKQSLSLVVNDEAFPTLGNNKKIKPKDEMNYLAIAKQEQKPEIIIDHKSVEPGWVKLWKNDNDGIIYSRYGLQTKWRLDEYLRDEEDFKIVAKQILNQWQRERNEITELLGDRSLYYDTPSLLEYLPEEDEDYYVKMNNDDSENDN